MQYIAYPVKPHQVFKPMKHKTAREFALDSLRSAIVAGNLAPGQELSLQELSQQMGISRTPVREAIQVLEVQGFVVQRHFSKPVVSPLSGEQIEEVHMIRKALEGMATYHACLNMDTKTLRRLKRLLGDETRAIEQGDALLWSQCNRQLHVALCAASGKSFLCRYIDWLLDLSTIYMLVAAKFFPQRLKESNREHVQIIHACEEKKAGLAQSLMEAHVGKRAALLVEYVRGGAALAQQVVSEGSNVLETDPNENI